MLIVCLLRVGRIKDNIMQNQLFTTNDRCGVVIVAVSFFIIIIVGSSFLLRIDFLSKALDARRYSVSLYLYKGQRGYLK